MTPPNCHLAPFGGVVHSPVKEGPVKEGEDAEEKLLLETIKRNNAKLLAIYKTWKTRAKAWIKDAEKAQG